MKNKETIHPKIKIMSLLSYPHVNLTTYNRGLDILHKVAKILFYKRKKVIPFRLTVSLTCYVIQVSTDIKVQSVTFPSLKHFYSKKCTLTQKL